MQGMINIVNTAQAEIHKVRTAATYRKQNPVWVIGIEPINGIVDNNTEDLEWMVVYGTRSDAIAYRERLLIHRSLVHAGYSKRIATLVSKDYSVKADINWMSYVYPFIRHLSTSINKSINQ